MFSCYSLIDVILDSDIYFKLNFAYKFFCFFVFYSLNIFLWQGLFLVIFTNIIFFLFFKLKKKKIILKIKKIKIFYILS